MKLTKTEKKLLARTRANGFVTMNDFEEFYTTPHYAKAKAQRLVRLGLLLITESQTFVIGKVEDELLCSYLSQ